ncbi:MAG: MFS transporter [Cardiobacteriaceae bacterium]|nr:MFS transporter [Cardiobacteriaceae bacterium]
MNKKLLMLFAALYGGQYTVIAFISVALAAILREQGASLSQLAILNLILLPISARFLWAPLIDRHAHAPDRLYRRFLLPAQIAMLLGLLLAAQLPPHSAFAPLAVLLFCYAVLTAKQDSAIDALACTRLAPETRQTVNAIQMASGMAGNLLGGGLLLLSYPHLGWQGSLMTLAALALPASVLLLVVRDPPVLPQKAPPRLPWRQMWQFWRGNGRWFAVIACYATAFAPFALLTPMLIDRQWEKADIGSAVKIYGSVVSLVATALFLSWLRRRKPSLMPLSCLFTLCLVAFLPIAFGAGSKIWGYAAISAYFIGFSPLYIRVNTLMMHKAAASNTPATLHGIQNAAAMLCGLLAGAAALWLADCIGYAPVILLSATAPLVAATLARRTVSGDTP